MISLLRPVWRPSVRSLNRFSSTIAPKQPSTIPHLTWNEFFALRQRRRRLSQACSIGAAIVGLGVGWQVISNIEVNATQTFMDIEIVWFLAAGIALTGVAGYLTGPTIGNYIFRQGLGKKLPSYIERDTEYLRRIRANRPDARRSNYSNPVNDYYGEKVGSLADYRKWLREANLFTRKSQKFL